jgi:hypothetical protein
MAIGAPYTILQDGATNRNSGTPTAATTNLAPGGSLIVCAISGNALSSLIDSAGNNYTKAIASNTNFDIEIWYCSNCLFLATGGTFTATGSGGSQYSLNVAAVVGGANGGFNASGANHVTGTSITVTSGTTDRVEEIAFAAINGLGGGTYTEDSNWTELASNPEATNPLAYRKLSAIGTTTWSPSWTNSLPVDGVIATFRATLAPLGGFAASEW